MAGFKLSENVPHTPFYHYDMNLLGQTIDVAISHSKPAGYHLHYAVKANSDDEILKFIAAKGLGADCVSGWEVKAALENGFKPELIVFAGVGKSDDEINFALDNNIFAFNCESLQEIEVINQLAKQKNKIAQIALRVNPNVHPDTHKYISTGQSESKFGIAYNEINAALEIITSLQNIEMKGLHFHIGSQVMDMSFFEQLALRAVEITKWFEEKGCRIDHLNMGGGLGVDYDKPMENPITNFESYFEQFKKHMPNDKTIHFELGRSIMAQCGELVTRVLFTKETANGSNYAIVDAGMTELIRPALYGAHHKIMNLSAHIDASKKLLYCIGGPICESSDVFANDIEFPKTQRGNILTIKSAGAYGAVMSSNYNLRPRANAYFDFK